MESFQIWAVLIGAGQDNRINLMRRPVSIVQYNTNYFEALRKTFHACPSDVRKSRIALPHYQFIDMPHNSAVVMWGGCQERYKHSVPPLPKGVGTHPMAGKIF